MAAKIPCNTVVMTRMANAPNPNLENAFFAFHAFSMRLSHLYMYFFYSTIDKELVTTSFEYTFGYLTQWPLQ